MSEKPYAIISDLDGTLAKRTDAREDPFNMETVGTDVPNEPIVELLNTLQCAYLAETIIVSARENQTFNGTTTFRETESWLARHGIWFDQMYMRAAKDYRDDAVVKEEIYREFIEPYYEVLYVLDDRRKVVSKWRELGLTCLAVDEGDF